ncbi:hypothetical protein [Actinomadura madurae]|uniref:hypothetical protein n=1 Tax=Actinomadura madurae TaxID=1993 RepID=UPI0020D1F8D2|nr:hypothetical protein [Actinomadura madurae]MCQ0013014.1 hypothetical protein [Actinomadura madurae]
MSCPPWKAYSTGHVAVAFRDQFAGQQDAGLHRLAQRGRGDRDVDRPGGDLLLRGDARAVVRLDRTRQRLRRSRADRAEARGQDDGDRPGRQRTPPVHAV